MKRRSKKMLGVLALGLGAAGAFLIKGPRKRKAARRIAAAPSVWARPGMLLTFRAELQPGRAAAERTFRVVKLLPNGRVILERIAGDHTEREFEPVRFD